MKKPEINTQKMLQTTSAFVFPAKSGAEMMLGMSRQNTLLEIPLFEGRSFLDSQRSGFLPVRGPQNSQAESSSPKDPRGVPETGKAQSLKENRLLYQESQVLNSKRGARESDSFLAELEKVQKKIKNQDSISNSSTQYEDPSDELQASTSLKSRSVSEPEPISIGNRPHGQKKIVQMCFDEITENYVYKVETDTNSAKLLLLTREEVIKEDPKILLYFYENHIQFSQTAHFRAEKLRKL